MLNIVIIAIVTIAIINWRTRRINQTHQGCLQKLTLTAKTAVFALPIFAHVSSSAIATLIDWGKETIIEIVYIALSISALVASTAIATIIGQGNQIIAGMLYKNSL